MGWSVTVLEGFSFWEHPFGCAATKLFSQSSGEWIYDILFWAAFLVVFFFAKFPLLPDSVGYL